MDALAVLLVTGGFPLMLTMALTWEWVQLRQLKQKPGQASEDQIEQEERHAAQESDASSRVRPRQQLRRRLDRDVSQTQMGSTAAVTRAEGGTGRVRARVLVVGLDVSFLRDPYAPHAW